jgi:c-di-GMP-related signal transduction protein
MNDSAITLARQPILGTDGKLFGYELLYRGARLESTGMGTTQTARVLCEAIGNIGLEHLVGDARVFVSPVIQDDRRASFKMTRDHEVSGSCGC